MEDSEQLEILKEKHSAEIDSMHETVYACLREYKDLLHKYTMLRIESGLRPGPCDCALCVHAKLQDD